MRGWPARTLVGEDGAQAAWLLAQHADQDPALQRAFLDALRSAVAEGEASPAHLAYLEDRVRVHAGQPQLYGTQFTVTDGEFGPYPIEDPQRLDERREEGAPEILEHLQAVGPVTKAREPSLNAVMLGPGSQCLLSRLTPVTERGQVTWQPARVTAATGGQWILSARRHRR